MLWQQKATSADIRHKLETKKLQELNIFSNEYQENKRGDEAFGIPSTC